MSTKQDPGEFDCYAKLAPDEPYFVLRAKDPLAPALIELWAEQRRVQYGVYQKLDEAVACAEKMRAWKTQHPEARPTVPLTTSEQSILRLKDRMATVIAAMRANPETRTSVWLDELEGLL